MLSTGRCGLVALVVVALVAVTVEFGRAAGAQRTAGRPGIERPTLAEARAPVSGAPQSVRGPASASWCGTATQTDQTPNVLAGNVTHWIYAIPSDGQDRFSSVASTMQTDAETIDGWWRSQDSVRAPRDDLVQLSCGAQLDISSVRLAQSASDLRPTASRFSTIANALFGLGFQSSYDKYVVYYDGPVEEPNLCGQGNVNALALGYAEVYVQACTFLPSAPIAAHELTHTLGAVPSGAPHMCPAPRDSHVCDSTTDLMYPFVDGPLSSRTLDVGRDDYYGHGGSWFDVQDSPWLVQLDRQAQLQVQISGPGRITADVPGLDCSESCTTTWNADTKLVLTAGASPNFKLVRWGGACSGSSACLVSVTQPTTLSALFAPETYRLVVKVSGKGAVRGSAAGIACPRRCSARASSYTPLRLSAAPAKGWRFKVWKGACRGTRGSCTLPMSVDTSARAVFVRR